MQDRNEQHTHTHPRGYAAVNGHSLAQPEAAALLAWLTRCLKHIGLERKACSDQAKKPRTHTHTQNDERCCLAFKSRARAAALAVLCGWRGGHSVAAQETQTRPTPPAAAVTRRERCALLELLEPISIDNRRDAQNAIPNRPTVASPVATRQPPAATHHPQKAPCFTIRALALLLRPTRTQQSWCHNWCRGQSYMACPICEIPHREGG